MKINFETKTESNKRRQEAFLALSGGERITSFLRLMEQVSFFSVKNGKTIKKGNFVIILPSQHELGK